MPNIYAFVCQLIAQTLIEKQEFNLTDQIVLQYAGHTWAHARCTSRRVASIITSIRHMQPQQRQQIRALTKSKSLEAAKLIKAPQTF